MDQRNVARALILLAAATVAAAQNQQQNQNQNQQQSQQPSQQTQQQSPPQNQPPQKKSFWQKVKDVTQQGQNTVQNGQSAAQNTVQNGQGAVQNTVQQGTQQVQGVQGMQNGTQSVQGLTNQGSATFSGGGGGAGACGTSCFDAGPFQANVSQMTMSQEGGWHIIRMNIQFHNATNQPLIIAYHDGSMVMVDNNGNTYIPAGGNPGQLQGMGIDRGQQTDSSFVLGPGQTGNALFSVARGRAANSPVGTGYSYNLTIDELQPQNGAMAIAVRQYTLNFPSLAPGVSSASFPGVGSNNYAAAGKGTAVSAAPVATTGAVTQGTGSQQKLPGATPSAQQRMVTGQQPMTPAAVVNKAAIKTQVSTAAATAKPVAAKPVAAKPVAARPTTPPKTTDTTTTTAPKQ
jgi:hypothetical protein